MYVIVIFPSPCVADPCIQISLWPSPRSDLYVADAHAIKVCGFHHDFSESVATDRRPSTGIVNDEYMRYRPSSARA